MGARPNGWACARRGEPIMSTFRPSESIVRIAPADAQGPFRAPPHPTCSGARNTTYNAICNATCNATSNKPTFVTMFLRASFARCKASGDKDMRCGVKVGGLVECWFLLVFSAIPRSQRTAGPAIGAHYSFHLRGFLVISALSPYHVGRMPR